MRLVPSLHESRSPAPISCAEHAGGICGSDGGNVTELAADGDGDDLAPVLRLMAEVGRGKVDPAHEVIVDHAGEVVGRAGDGIVQVGPERAASSERTARHGIDHASRIKEFEFPYVNHSSLLYVDDARRNPKGAGLTKPRLSQNPLGYLVLDLPVALHQHELVALDELLVVGAALGDKAGFLEDADQFASLHVTFFLSTTIY